MKRYTLGDRKRIEDKNERIALSEKKGPRNREIARSFVAWQGTHTRLLKDLFMLNSCTHSPKSRLGTIMEERRRSKEDMVMAQTRDLLSKRPIE